MKWKPSKPLFHVCNHIVLEPEDAFRHCCDAAGVRFGPEQAEQAGGQAGRCREGPVTAGNPAEQQAPAPAEPVCKQNGLDLEQQAAGEPPARQQQAAAGAAGGSTAAMPAEASPIARSTPKGKQKGLPREGTRRSARGVEAAQRAEQAKQLEEDAALALQQLWQGLAPCALCPACGQPMPPGSLEGVALMRADCKKITDKQQRRQEGRAAPPVCQPALPFEAPQARPMPPGADPDPAPQAAATQPVIAFQLQQEAGLDGAAAEPPLLPGGAAATSVGQQQGEASQHAGREDLTPEKGKRRWSKKRRREEASRPDSPASAMVAGTQPAPSTQAVLRQPGQEQLQGEGAEVQRTPGKRKGRHGRRSSMAGAGHLQGLQQPAEQEHEQQQEQQQGHTQQQLERVAESEGMQLGQGEPSVGVPPEQQRPSRCNNWRVDGAAVAAVFADWGVDGYPHPSMPALVERLQDPAYTAPQEWSVPEAMHLCLLAHSPEYFRAHIGRHRGSRKAPSLLAAHLRRDFDSDVSEVLFRYRGRVAVAACGGPGARSWEVATQLRRDFPRHWQGLYQRIPPQLLRDGGAGCDGCHGGPSREAQQGLLPAQQQEQGLEQQQEGEEEEAAAAGAAPAPAVPLSPDNSAGRSQPQEPSPSTGTSMLLGPRSRGNISAALNYVSTFLADLGE